ncbi:hypothetical protein [Flavihumibacter petaseus]|uniref:Uncharacterized protein n=1 Tax=Flavihumibacter petaseus NBRC 106054 TaxID=1220578 RepID=A0A0E9N309_9BACT|nr:hypothetical protein [Flavihumibacter petaseus]GAO44051.1 hypothetical protein FPE01S_03_00910 [Flavihumibacter petaseus NBRC 106054]
MYTPRELNKLLFEVIMAGNLPIKDSCAGGHKIIIAQEVFADGHIIETDIVNGARVYQPTAHGIEFLINGGYEYQALQQQRTAVTSSQPLRLPKWRSWAFGLAGAALGVLAAHFLNRQ